MTRDESGQVLVLAVGLALVCFAAAGLAIDGTRAFLARRSLQNAADAAVVGAAAEIDVRAYYRSGGTSVQVAPAAAERRARDILARRGLNATTSMYVGDDQVRLTMRSETATTFLKLVGIETIPVAVSATADPLPQRAPIGR